jgi:FKBP-type peptidyl-prolyl cis-trans isomerase FkpA
MRLRIPGTAFLLIGSFILAGSAACGGSPSTPSPTDPSQNLNVPYSQIDLVVGTGRQAANGNNVSLNYTGWLYYPTATDNKGTQFDTSALRGPLTFRLGQGAVIRGWDQGIVGMAVGGKRRLVIPPSLGYGSTGSSNGAIPPNATILFDVELVTVTD